MEYERRQYLDELTRKKDNGIRNIVALRGDLPDPTVKPEMYAVDLLHCTRLNRNGRHRNNQRQRGRTIHSDGHTVMRGHRVRLAVQGHGDIHGHRANQHQHDDEHNQQSRIVADGLQINRRARNDEENRNAARKFSDTK